MAATGEPSVRTHKEQDGYAEDYDHDWPTTSVPRRPEFFEPVPPAASKGWSHFVDAVKSRNIPGETIRNIIETGDVYQAEGENRYRFLWTEPVEKTTYSLIVELRAEAFAYEAENHYAITVYRVER